MFERRQINCWVLLTQLMLLMGLPGQCAKVLLIPSNVNSHVLFFHRLASGLADKGHATTMLLPDNSHLLSDLGNTSVNVLKYPTESPVPFANSEELSRKILESATKKNLLFKLLTLWEVAEKWLASFLGDCERMMTEESIQRHLREVRYDIAIVDAAGNICQYALPYKFDLPHVTFGVPIVPFLAGVPALPSFVPSLTSEFSDSMTFQERLLNAFYSILPIALGNHSTSFVEKHVPEKAPQTPLEFLSSSVLYFNLKVDVLAYPSPSMPNTIDIGDIMATPAKQLPGHLQTLMDSSKDGVIILSLGSFVDYFPEEMVEKFCQALIRLKETVVWKTKMAPSCAKSDNIKVLPWIPQNDLLGHNNAKLFITHGGLNSLIESIYHGVPMVVMPLGMDQNYNAAMVRHKRYGLQADISDFTSDELVEKIQEVLMEGSFRERTRMASEIMKHKPESAAARASFMIDHVVKFGGEHLETKAKDLSLLQFMMFDIFLFVLFSLVLLVALLVLVICALFKCIRKIYRRDTSKLKTK